MIGTRRNSVLEREIRNLLKESRSDFINILKKLMQRPKRLLLIRMLGTLKVFLSVLFRMVNTLKTVSSLIRHKYTKETTTRVSNKVMENLPTQSINTSETLSRIFTQVKDSWWLKRKFTSDSLSKGWETDAERINRIRTDWTTMVNGWMISPMVMG